MLPVISLSRLVGLHVRRTLVALEEIAQALSHLKATYKIIQGKTKPYSVWDGARKYMKPQYEV